MKTLFRILWYVHRTAGSVIRLLVFRVFAANSFFRRVGPGTQFFGWPSFGTCNANISIGENCLIGRGVFFSASPESEIRIGDGCSINTMGHLIAVYGISIGEGTRIGEFVTIRDQNHATDAVDTSVSQQGYTGGPIAIGENCWIGRGVFIGAGVTIGNGVVVGANAVVVRDIPDATVVGGVPARILKHRDQPSHDDSASTNRSP